MSNFFRLKTNWVCEDEEGNLVKTKTEELVEADTYTEAETIECTINTKMGREKIEPATYEIVKAKIDNMLYNSILSKNDDMTCKHIETFFDEKEETGMGMYSVKACFFETDEKGKEKKRIESYHVPAHSNTDATMHVKSYVEWKYTFSPSFVIKEVKFDKAEAVYWTEDSYTIATNTFDKYGEC